MKGCTKSFKEGENQIDGDKEQTNEIIENEFEQENIFLKPEVELKPDIKSELEEEVPEDEQN